MKCLNSLFLVLALTSLSSPAFAAGAGGGMDGGGGDVVILKDDQVVLADPFVKKTLPRGTSFTLHPQIVAELKLMGVMFNIYGAGYHGASNAFIENEILSPLIEYRFASAIPAGCERVNVGPLPEGATYEIAACTRGFKTWIREDLFKKMTIREQAKLILHERLRALKTAPDADDIVDLTNGVESILSLYFKEINNPPENVEAGTPFWVDAEEIELFRKRVAQHIVHGNEPNWWTDWKVWRRGGGLVHRSAKIAEDNLVGITIGVGSLVGDTSTLNWGTRILGLTNCRNNTCELESRAMIVSNSIGSLNADVHMEHRAQIINSQIELRPIYEKIQMGSWSRIINAKIQFAKELTLAQGATIEDSTLFFYSTYSPVSMQLERLSKIKGINAVNPIQGFSGFLNLNTPRLIIETEGAVVSNLIGGSFPCNRSDQRLTITGNEKVRSLEELSKLCR